MTIGVVIGKASTQRATVFVFQEAKTRVGQHVILEHDEGILGLITSVITDSPVLDDNTSDEGLVKDLIFKKYEIIKYRKARVKLLCKLKDLTLPDSPPPPGTRVRLALDDELTTIFSNGNIRIGTLIRKNVEVKIDVNAVARHLAILAATGAGKSNTVAVLSSRIAEKGGTVIIFDYHGEYYNSDIKNLNVIEPKINPLYLEPDELATLLEIKVNVAHIQSRIIRKAFKEVKEEIEGMIKSGSLSLGMLNTQFLVMLKEKVEELRKNEKREKVAEVLNKIEEFGDRYSNIISLAVGDIVGRIMRGKVNVVNLRLLSGNAVDAVVSHYLRRILEARKEYNEGKHGLQFPVFVVIEEAHVLLSKNKYTLTKYWAGTIAREGRKFGVGLVIVSQRPKGIDVEILSQMTNKIILRMIEPTDKKYILGASDNLSEDMVKSISSFNDGEALIVGNIVKIPTVVKIDKFEGKLGGGNPNMLGQQEDYSDVLDWG